MKKNLFEHTLNMKVESLSLMQQDSFDYTELVADMRNRPVHIYMICRAPIIKVNPESVLVTKDQISLEFYVEDNGIKDTIKIETVNREDEPIGKIEIPFPYTQVMAYRPSGDVHSEHKASFLLRYLCYQNDILTPHLDLEVLYIGQAFGKNGERITVDRLQKHEKAQRIYFDTQQKFPEKEIWFLSLTVVPLLFSMSQLEYFNDEKMLREGLDHLAKIEANPIELAKQITVTEASMIRYFNTYEYNKEYLDFPSQEHKSYEEVYKMDFNCAGFELTSYSIKGRLWSKTKPPSFSHLGQFFLHDEQERRNMLKWFEKKE